MKRLCLFSAGSFTIFSLLVGGLAACGSDGPREFGPGSAGASGSPGGSTAGSPGVAGAPVGVSGAPASGGSPSGGSSNAGGAGSSGGGAPGASGSGTGGTGAAGAGTAGGSAGSAGSAGSGGTPVNAILRADFESDTAGKQPAGWHNFLAYNTDTTNPQGDIQAIVDATRPHGGKNSLHVKGGQSPAFLTFPLPANTRKLYVRGYFYMTRKLGQNPGANHETLFGIRKDKDNEIRFGEIKGIIGVNEVPSDNIMPKMDQWGKGPLIAANQWACIEAGFIGDQTQNELHAWADGTEVLSVTSGDQWQNSVEPKDWLSTKWNEFMIGWQSFSSASNEIWIDDLVLASSRIGCL